MRQLTIIRQKRFVASVIRPFISIDGVVKGQIKNGETTTIELDENEHEVKVEYSSQTSNLLIIKPGIENLVARVDFISQRFVLKGENGAFAEGQSFIPNLDNAYNEKKLAHKSASIITAIIIGLIMTIFALVMFVRDTTSVIGLCGGLLFAGLTTATMIIGGFWFVLIPLPYIFIWRAGCVKPDLSMKMKILMLILTFVSVALFFVSIFALAGINF